MLQLLEYTLRKNSLYKLRRPYFLLKNESICQYLLVQELAVVSEILVPFSSYDT